MNEPQKQAVAKFKVNETVYFTQLGGQDPKTGKYRTLYFTRKIAAIKPNGFGFIYKFIGGTCFVPEYVIYSRASGDLNAKKEPDLYKIME